MRLGPLGSTHGVCSGAIETTSTFSDVKGETRADEHVWICSASTYGEPNVFVRVRWPCIPPGCDQRKNPEDPKQAPGLWGLTGPDATQPWGEDTAETPSKCVSAAVRKRFAN